MNARYGCSEDRLAHYTCFRAPESIQIDGCLDKPVWRLAPKSHRFVDLITGDPGFLDTRIACLWDERALYIGYWIEEPDVRAALTKRDDFLWQENVVELFIGGDDCYYELEINALGTIFEAFFIWQDALKKGSRFDVPQFDLHAGRVDIMAGYTDGRYGKHPRGKRWAFLDWDLEGLQSAVQVDGTLNDSSTLDKGWMVELALPWSGMQSLFAHRTGAPKEGDVLRMAFTRSEILNYLGARADRSPAWCLNPHGAYDFHIPECFSFVHFTERPAGSI